MMQESASDILKEFYEPMMREELNSHAKLMNQLGVDPPKKRSRIVRRYWKVRNRLSETMHTLRHGASW